MSKWVKMLIICIALSLSLDACTNEQIATAAIFGVTGLVIMALAGSSHKCPGCGPDHSKGGLATVRTSTNHSHH